MSKIFGFCKNCKYRLTAVALEEKTEQPEFKQNLEQNIFSLLPPAQTEFLVTFLQNQGNIAVTAKELLLTQQETIACLQKLLAVLGLELHELPKEEPVPQTEPTPEAESPSTLLEQQAESSNSAEEESSSSQEEEFLFPLDKPIDAEFLQQFLHYPDGDEEEESQEELEEDIQEVFDETPHEESIQPAVFETLHREDLQQVAPKSPVIEPIQQAVSQQPYQPAPFQPSNWQPMTQQPHYGESVQPPYWNPMAQPMQTQGSFQQPAFQAVPSQNWQQPTPQQPVVQEPIEQKEPVVEQPTKAEEVPSPSLSEKTLEEMLQNPLSEEDLQKVMQQSVSEELLLEVMSSEEELPRIMPSVLKQQTITQPTYTNPYLTHSLKMQPLADTPAPSPTESAPNAEQPFAPISSKASERIRQKLYACGGTAEILSITKKPYHVSANQDGKSFSCDKLSFEFNYEVFDIIVDLLNSNGGKAEKGSSKGVKFGDPKCNQNTVVGAIAKKYFGAKKGDTVYDPVSVLASILEWAEIAENCRGYIKLK